MILLKKSMIQKKKVCAQPLFFKKKVKPKKKEAGKNKTMPCMVFEHAESNGDIPVGSFCHLDGHSRPSTSLCLS